MQAGGAQMQAGGAQVQSGGAEILEHAPHDQLWQVLSLARRR
jgi:hypothetical protein